MIKAPEGLLSGTLRQPRHHPRWVIAEEACEHICYARFMVIHRIHFSFWAGLALVIAAISSPMARAGFQTAEEFARPGHDPVLEELQSALEVIGDQAISLSTLLSGWPEAIECATCSSALCSTCITRDNEGLSTWNAKWNELTNEEKAQGIIEVGKLSCQHAHHSNPQIEKFLRRGLAQKSHWTLRSSAIYALGHQPNSEDLFQEFKAESDKHHAKTLKLRTEFLANRAKLIAWRKQDMRNSGVDPVARSFEIQALKKVVHREWIAFIKLEQLWRATVLAMGNSKSEAASSTLAQLVHTFDQDTLPPFFVEALLIHPTLIRIEAALHNVHLYETRIGNTHALIKLAKKKRPRKTPKWYLKRHSHREWKATFRAEQLTIVEDLEYRNFQTLKKLEKAHSLMAAWAVAAGHKAPKVSRDRYSKSWQTWLKRNKKILDSTALPPSRKN